MKHNPIFVNGYPAICPQEDTRPHCTLIDNQDIPTGFWIERWSPVKNWERGMPSRIYIGFQCGHCGVFEYEYAEQTLKENMSL